MFRFKVGDTVKVASGKDKGREGKIERIFPRELLVLIPGINIYKKHIKGGRTSGGGTRKGGIYEVPRPLPIAKIALVCPKCRKTTKVGFEVRKDSKVRVCKKCKSAIEVAA